MNKFNIPYITMENDSYINRDDVGSYIWKFNKSFIKEGEKWITLDGSPLSDITNSRVISNVLYGVVLDKFLNDPTCKK